MEDLEINVKDIVTDIIEDEKASMSLDASKPIEISDEAKENEQDLEKIAPIEESKALKTQSPNKKWLTAFIFIAINVIAILLTLVLEFVGDEQPTDFGEAVNIFKANWLWGLFAVGLVVISIIAEGLKRYVLLYKTLNKKLPIISLNAAIICKYYNNITPLAAGGQPFEIYYLRKKGIPVGIASGVPLVAYALNKISYVFVSLVCLLIYGFGAVSTPIKVLAVIGIIANLLVPLAIIFFTVMPKVSNAVSRFIAKMAMKLHLVKDAKAYEEKLTASIVEYADCISYFLKKSKMSILISFICSVIFYLAVYSLPYAIVKLCGAEGDSWGKMLTYCIICYATVALLPTPGGSGGAEVSFRSIFAKFIAADGGMVLWGILTWRLLSYYSFIALGLIVIIAQQVVKFSKKVVSGEIFENHTKPEPIPEEDELEPYTPVPTTQVAEDEINSAEVVVLTETTIEEETPIVPAEIDTEVEDSETVIEFTAVIESKSTVVITEEKIEVLDTPEKEQELESEDNSQPATTESEEVLADGDNLAEVNNQPVSSDSDVVLTKQSLDESNEQDSSNRVDVKNQSTINDLKQSTVIVEENTPNVTVITSPLSQVNEEELLQTCTCKEEDSLEERETQNNDTTSIEENSLTTSTDNQSAENENGDLGLVDSNEEPKE